MEQGKVFMAFGQGKESVETVNKKYIGVGVVNVLAVNPNKAALEKIYNTTIENEPEYIGENEIDGNKVKQVRLDFILQTVPEKNDGINIKTRISFFISDSYRYNRDKTKMQVINKYGEVAWLSIEDIKAGTVPESMKWFDAEGMRPAFVGEEDLTTFIKTYLGIPNRTFRKANGEVVEISDKREAEARLDNIKKYFSGDYSEIQDVLALQPDNKIKVLFGVRTVEDKQYQTVFTNKFLRFNAPEADYTKLDRAVQERKQMGAYATTEFKICPMCEYTVEATDFNQTNTDPFAEDSPWV